MNSQTQLSEQQPLDFFNLLITFCVLIFIWFIAKVKTARKNQRHMSFRTTNISSQKIIIALEIKDFFVKYSTRPQNNYLRIDIEKEENLLVKSVKKLFSIGHFYRPLYHRQKIKDFITGLKNISNVELYIYTSLPSAITNIILTKLQLIQYFPESQRKYCDLENNDDQKHAIQIDQDSRRVIIITPTHDDHTYEDDKYFLVLKPKKEEINFLKNSLKTLKTFIQETDDINSMHEKLGELKVNLQSDWSGDDL